MYESLKLKFHRLRRILRRCTGAINGGIAQEYQIKLLHGKLEQARGGHLAKECQTPCSVETFAGNNSLQVTGPESFYKTVLIPKDPAKAEVVHGQTMMRYTGMGFVYTGASLALVGPAFFAYYKLDKGISGGVTTGFGALCALVGGILWGAARHNAVNISPARVVSRFGIHAPRLASLGAAPTAQGATIAATVTF